MKYWMLTLTCIGLLPASLSFAASDAATAADNVFREGVAYCNQASKLSRTDTEQARTQYSKYLSHLERAKTIDTRLLDNNSFAQREHKRCTLIDDNIARAEAMPIVEQSLAQCEQARAALDASNLEQASESFNQFQSLRDQALAVTPTVLRVGSLAVRMRVCDRLVEKISLAQSDQQLALQKASRALTVYNKALASCDVGRGMSATSSLSTEAVKALEDVLSQVNKQLSNGDALGNGLDRSVGDGQQLAAIRNRVTACSSDIVASVASMNTKLEQQALMAKKAEDAAIQPPQLAVQAELSILQGQEIVQIGDGSL
ncbi:hypothetical protein [Ketobacter alkanivorans]|uniref:Uncharacterized protein n=1 Tax=Ketobacter alkanivorans TaxID=1917421 RepID=A0A2K9LR02_9GAMM|nr:hypothetical protein [Ketobacter alkanivorans]AUM14670.1 hypothetical protein Kalk_20535 [Ketobacter alkanivorans]